MNPKILWLRERFNWMGQHSGYDQVCEAIAKLQSGNYQSVWREPDKPLLPGSYRLLSFLASRTKSSPYYTPHSIAAEISILWKSWFQGTDLVHITYVENQLGILSNWSQRLFPKVIGTVHQPASWWRMLHPYPDRISSIEALIVCASKEIAYFEQYLPGKVYFIPHGVDIAFFRPKPETTNFKIDKNSPRCVFSGKWLRDIQTLATVIEKVIAQNPGIGFDMIVPSHSRDDPLFFRIARHEQVSWHANLSDEQLREIYQQANMLVLPLLDCTANNALLEAIACGLPIISNDVGGLPDYTRDTFADLLPVGDVEGMTSAILNLADDIEAQKTRGNAARLFAEKNLSWDRVAAQTLEIYHKVISN